MQNGIAFSNNDIITIAWSYWGKLPGCMGFAIYRIDGGGKETPLPSMAVFPGFKRKKGQTTQDFPLQKFYWKDVYARAAALKTGQRRFRYKIVPLSGTPGKLVPMSIGQVVTNEVEISAACSDHLTAYFNRGLISTQRVSRAFKGKPAKGPLLARIGAPGDELRESLGGDMIGTLSGFLERAKKSGAIYAALYELGDEQLIQALEGLKTRLHIVLSFSKVTDRVTKKVSDGNADARLRLEKSGADLHNRMLANNQIGHNKFLVYVDGEGKAQAALFGSTNWTSTGLCAQTNNTIVVDNAQVAKRYWDYWKKLKKDTDDADEDPKGLQAPDLREWDGSSEERDLGADGNWTSWFSPNTPKLRSSSKTKKEVCPPDMSEVASVIAEAKKAVLFLAFYPGSPSLADWAAAAQKADKNLFVRGCVTNPSAAESFYYGLLGSVPPPKVKGQKTVPKHDDRVIAAAALGGDDLPSGWAKEMLNAGFAVVHDKIIVVDPFSENCVVVTGSHNLGYKASFNNDENLIIVRGNRRLAEAYATHVLDVYDHFAWRHLVVTEGAKKADQSLKTNPDEWQEKYFDANGEIRTAQMRFWLSALPVH